MIQRRKVSGQIPYRTDGNKEEKGIWKRGRERHWKTWGRGLSEHPIPEKGGLGVGDRREETGGIGWYDLRNPFMYLRNT